MLGYINLRGVYAEQTGASGQALGTFPQAFTYLAFGPKAQPFIQRRAKPWYIGRTARYILKCLAVFGPTGEAFA
ncbi:MAG: hypothetical protein ACLQNE_30250 [Thermoguttaceae bacterium]|jgi:hypothetical protein